MYEDDDYDGVQYDTFNGPRAAYRCVLCGETYPRPERLNNRNECADCVGAAGRPYAVSIGERASVTVTWWWQR